MSGSFKVAVAALLVAACSGEPIVPGEAPPPGDALFEPCPLHTETGEGEAECAVFERPLLTDDPGAGTIPIFVKRVRATAPRRGQVWYLPGGPGASSRTAEWVLEERSQSLPDLDVYVPDHRGSGQSALLQCPGAADFAECGEILSEEWGAGLAGFRTTEAARDVAAVIAATRTRNDQIFVHGASYGGYWLHRLLVVDPEAVDAALFESSSRGTSEGGTHELAMAPDEAGHWLFELCADDPDCSAHLGDDGYAVAREVVATDGGCAGILRAEIITRAFDDWRLRMLIPVLVYRAERCSEQDRTWTQKFAIALGEGQSETRPPEIFNDNLLFHIFVSEAMGSFDDALLTEVAETKLFNNVSTLRTVHEEFADWPVYGRDEFTHVWAETSIHTLLLHGRLDATTALSGATELSIHLGSHAQLVELSSADHGVEEWPYPEFCGRNLVHQFLSDPAQPLDLSCVEAAPPYTFAQDPEWLLDAFGTDNLWGD